MLMLLEQVTPILGVVAIAARAALSVALYCVTTVSATARAQLEEGISEKERALLVRLRDSLGISESDAEAIENDLQSRLPSFA